METPALKSTFPDKYSASYSMADYASAFRGLGEKNGTLTLVTAPMLAPSVEKGRARLGRLGWETLSANVACIDTR